MVDYDIKLTFDESVKGLILDSLEKSVDEEGMLVEKNNPSQRVLDFKGEEISFEEFGGVKKGSELFIKNNLISLMKIVKKMI